MTLLWLQNSTGRCRKAIIFLPLCIRILPFCPIGAGRTAEPLPELCAEMAAAAQAAVLCDLRDGQVRFDQQFAGHLQPEVLQIFAGRGVQALLKTAVAGPLAAISRRGDGRDGQLFGVMCMEKQQHLLDFFAGRIRAAWCGREEGPVLLQDQQPELGEKRLQPQFISKGGLIQRKAFFQQGQKGGCAGSSGEKASSSGPAGPTSGAT